MDTERYKSIREQGQASLNNWLFPRSKVDELVSRLLLYLQSLTD
jgi:hypothetical protein